MDLIDSIDHSGMPGAPSGDAAECPVCAEQNATIISIRKAQEESANMHELFLDALGKSRDKFGTVSEWFGRGVMDGGAA